MKPSNLKSWAKISPAMQSMLLEIARNVGGMRAALAHVFDECVAEKIPLGKDTLSDLGKFDDLYGEIEAQITAETEAKIQGEICARCANWDNKTEFCTQYQFKIKNRAIVGCKGYR